MYCKKQVFCILDYETFSEANIKEVGSYEYAMHSSTEVLCASWRIGTREQLPYAEVESWAPKKSWNKHRRDLRNSSSLRAALLNKNIIIVAHNALFEQAVTRLVLHRHFKKLLKGDNPFEIPPSRFFCTAVQAAVYALPRKLEKATEALELEHQKDMEGHRLMLKWSKPRKPTKKDKRVRQSNPDEFDRMVQYCEHDIYAETDLFLALEMHNQSERDLWIFDQEINFKGINVDVDLVDKILKLIAEEKKLLTRRLIKLTKGVVKTGGQREVILQWITDQGSYLPDLKAKTVDDAIKDGLVTGRVKKVLEIRQLLNKTSLKKYIAFKRHTTSDGRVRFTLIFNGASTGRWTGTGVQLHNCPRGTLKYKHTHDDGYEEEIDLAPYACELIKNGADLEFIRSQFENPMEVFISCIRGMLIPSEGHEFFVADYAAIEARILFWLADHHEGVKAFKEGRKMYEEMAMDIFIKKMKDISKDERFVGKQTILGSGYGMGWKKFQSSCRDLGREVTVEVSKKAINSYREKHKQVPELWKKIEHAAISAVKNPTKTFKINHTEWFMKGRFLCCRLPSGRILYYCDPSVKNERTPWGAKKPVLYHMGVNSKNKKWMKQKTWGGVLVENIVQAISRDLLAHAMLKEQEANYKILLTVHDELIGERKKGKGDIKEFCRLMEALPKWAKGAPVKVEGWKGERYRK